VQLDKLQRLRSLPSTIGAAVFAASAKPATFASGAASTTATASQPWLCLSTPRTAAATAPKRRVSRVVCNA